MMAILADQYGQFIQQFNFLNQQFNSLHRKYLRQLRNEITKEVDNEEVQTNIEGQIELLSGNKLLYERMHKNLKEHKFESLFAHEQMKLYVARTGFFLAFCGRRPSLLDYTTPYHITKNFEVVLAMVYSTSDLLNTTRHHNPSCPEDCKCLVEYFEEDEDESDNAGLLFDREGMMALAKNRNYLERYELGFNDGAQMIMAVHRVGPCSLFESALKATVLNDLSLEEVPKEIQKKASHGVYNLGDDIPENLTQEGKHLFRRLKGQYEDETGRE